MTDPLAQAWRTTQTTQHLDRLRRGTQVCACGAEYHDSADGRRQHQTLHGHRPCAPRTTGADS